MGGPARDDEQAGELDGSSSAPEPASAALSDEHAVLWGELAARTDAVLGEADEGRWPQPELRALLDYLHVEVLQQVVDEEWLLFRTARHIPDELARLRRDHLELRLAIEGLDRAGAGGGSLTPKQLAAMSRDLLTQLDAHLAAEETALSVPGAETPSTASLGSQPREWYALTEGPVLDLDMLPGDQGADAALDRLLQLRRGEQVELRASTDPGPLWQRLTRDNPGGYGVEYLDQGPPLWRVAITCRPTD